MDIDGYKSYHSFRHDRMGGGVSIYVDESLKSEYVDDLSINGEIFEVMLC